MKKTKRRATVRVNKRPNMKSCLITLGTLWGVCAASSGWAADSSAGDDTPTHIFCRSVYGGPSGGTKFQENTISIVDGHAAENIGDAVSDVIITYDAKYYDMKINYKNKRSNETVENDFYVPSLAKFWARRAAVSVGLTEQEVQGVRVTKYHLICRVLSKQGGANQ